MDRRIFSLCRLLTLLSSFWAFEAWAAAYSLPAATFAACTGSWNATTHTCGSRVVFQTGDTLTVTTALTLRANAGFELKGNNSLGVGGATVSLASTYGSIVINTGSVVNGSLTSASGTIELTGSRVTGTVTGTGSGRFTNSTIAGSVSLQNGLTAVDSTLNSTLTASNGTVTLSGGSVAGLINAACCKVTVSQGATISNGILAGSNGIDISDSTVSGALKAGNNPIKLTNVTMTSGSIDAGSNDVTISAGSVIANIFDANNVLIRGASVTGDVQARYTVKLENSTVTGDIHGRPGYQLQNVDLSNSHVYGDVIVGTSWETITGDSRSTISGDCTYKTVNPLSLCEEGGTPSVHHYELSYSSQALTCQPHPVTISACLDEACTSKYTAGQSSVTLTPSGWMGGNAIGFTGSTVRDLAVRSAQTVNLGAGNQSPTASGSPAVRCRIDGVLSTHCALTFKDSGLKVEAPALMAGKPDTLTISAVRKDDNSLQCVPAFAGVDRPDQLRGAYIDPSPTEQVGGHLIRVNGSSVSTTAVTLNLHFDNNGQADASLRYDDAGEMQLKATYQGAAARGDEDLLMEGVTQFVSRPYGLHIEYENGSHECVGTTLAACDKLRAAGDEFALHIRAVAWLYDNQPLSDLAGNPTTPNFRLSNIPLTSHVEAPAGSVSQGSWSPGDYNHALGVRTSLPVSQSEVGIFKLRAEAANYLGFLVAGENLRVGRFVPDHLEVSGQAQMNSCDGFSYQREPVPYRSGGEPQLLVKAFNRAGQLTLNYDLGEFWRLPRPSGTYWTQGGGRQLHLKTPATPTGKLELLVPVEDQAGADDGDGKRTFRWKGNGWRYDSGSQTPGPDDLPFSIEQHFIFKEEDGVCVRRSGESSCLGEDEPFVLDYTDSEIRLGRLKIGNAHGSELQKLDLPWVIQSWQNTAGATGFQKETLDLCTATSSLPNVLGVPALSQTLGDLKTVTNQQIDFQSGNLHLDAPGVPGSVSVSFPDLEGWLHYDGNGDGSLEIPSGLATFGIYRGHDNIIFRREVIGR